MAINVLRGRGRTAQHEEPEPLAIGEVDTEIFGCPICSRPLAVGARRCPGCRTRLVMGKPLRRVSGLAVLGVVGSIALVVAAVTLISVMQALAARASAMEGPGPARSPAPSVAAGDPSGGGPGPVAAPVPIATRSAMDQSVAINFRLLDGSAKLHAALGRKDLDSAAVAGILRNLASDATFGSGLVPRIAAWPEAETLALDLDDLYAAVRSTARGGLAASMTNDRAYRTAAQRMVVVLRRVPAMNSGIRTLATEAALDLPSLPDVPSPAPSGTSVVGDRAQPA